MNSFQTILSEHSITVDELVRESARIEQITPRDRQLRLARKAHRRSAQGTSYADAGIEKPRSGAPLHAYIIDRALRGGPVGRRQRAKILRALNNALLRRGQQPVAATDFVMPRSTESSEQSPISQ